MRAREEPLPETGQGPPRLTVGTIARAHGEAFKTQHSLREAERKVLRALMTCRTSVLGGRLDVCATCGDPIPEERLDAVPYAVLCVADKRRHEHA